MKFLSIFGDYRFLSACGFITALTCYALAVLILSANRRSRLCQIAFAFKLSVGMWSLFYSLMFFIGNGAIGLLVNKALTVSALFIGVFFLHLTAEITNDLVKWKKIIIGNYVFSFITSGLVLLSNFFVASSVTKLDFKFYIDGGSLYLLIPMQMLFSVTACMVILIPRMREETYRPRKQQLVIYFWATVLGFATGTPAYLLAFDIPVKPVTTPLVLIYPILMTYAILKHRFFDIRKLARNTLVFSLLFVCLLAVVSTLLFIFQKVLLERAGLSANVGQFLAIVLALMLYTPLKKGLSAVTRKLLYQHVQDAALVFGRLSEDLFKFIDIKKLSDEMTIRVSSCLALETIAFYRYDQTHNRFQLQSTLGSHRGCEVINNNDALIQYLAYSENLLLNRHGVRETTVNLGVSQALQTPQQIRAQALNRMIQGDWAIALPMFNRTQLDSLILLGHKKSDAAWTQEELSVLESFAHSFSLALVNAEAAEAIRVLQRKILASERAASAGALIAGVDHEAKNPLHAATLALSALEGFLKHPKFLAESREAQEGTVKETMQSVLEDIEEVNHVIQHLSNLAEQKPLHFQGDVSLADICRKALKTCGVANSLRLNLDIPEDFRLTCDPDAVQEILANLIRNAAQAGAGDVWLRAFGEGDTVIVEVRDSGGGISTAVEKRIFEPFFTTKGEVPDASSGTGMGLFIVRESMRAMGGDIELMPSSGQGAVFRLIFKTLPLVIGGETADDE